MRSKAFDPDEDIPDLSGKVILITGGNQGIGQATTLALAKHNPKHIYFTARSQEKAQGTLAKLKALAPNVLVTVLKCDLASLRSVADASREFSARSDALDTLILNAGAVSESIGKSEDGYELHIATNHMGHALLTKLLLPTLERNAHDRDTRIIVLSSLSAKIPLRLDVEAFKSDGSLNMFQMPSIRRMLLGTQFLYGESKLANLYFARSLAIHHPSITSVSVHPGVVQTNLIENQSFLQRNSAKVLAMWSGSLKTPEQGAFNTLWAATTNKSNLKSGAYYEPVGIGVTGTKAMQDLEAAEVMWVWTEKELKSWCEHKVDA